MLSRKLFALFVLIGALGFFVLIYLYFFVYYTATIVIIANEDNYSGELVSIQNAQNRKFNCVQRECIITDVPPFDYRLTLFKDDFVTQSMSVSIEPRSTSNIEISFMRQARLTLTSVVLPEAQNELFDDSEELYSAFSFGETGIFVRELGGNRLALYYKNRDTETLLREIERVPVGEIRAEEIEGISEIFIRTGSISYIYNTLTSNLTELPFRTPVSYIKPGVTRGTYQVVTEVGTFLYSRQTETSNFQYLFFDYVVLSEEQIIGIVGPDEDEKRQNFSLPESRETLIVLYNSRTRERQILLSTSQEIQRIFKNGSEVYFVTNENIRYRLENY